MRRLTKATYLLGLFSLGLAAVSCDTVGYDEHPEETSALRSTSSSILMSEDFNGSNPLSQVHQQFGTGHAFNVVEDPRDRSNKVGRFELRYGDPITSNGIRSEVLFPPQEDKERWYSYSIYVPSDEFEEDSDNDIIAQWHQTGGGSPATTLRIHNGKWLVKSGETKDKREDYVFGDVEKDKWHEFVFHFVHSHGSDGILEVWHNGEKVMERKGGNMHDLDLPRWKVGIYKASWASRSTDTRLRTLYFDNLKVGDRNADLEAMAPRATAAARAEAEARAEQEAREEAERKAEEERRAAEEAKEREEQEAREREEAERKAAEEEARAAAEAEARATAEAEARAAAEAEARAAAEAEARAAAEAEARAAAEAEAKAQAEAEARAAAQPVRPTPPPPSNPESPNTNPSTGGSETPTVPYNSHQREEQRGNGGR
ncbi:polysaccharide lyase [Litoribacter ruber]|uniref:polysaccharide lyase n=1 Tax=Litoribacter ruber TaxID=702568 RepID=UPI001BD9B54C|nr:polysaccharide lyase [Litoribacter ruber]MBT0809952.1 polysaccharide lyase [Litoribacter ruber]